MMIIGILADQNFAIKSIEVKGNRRDCTRKLELYLQLMQIHNIRATTQNDPTSNV